MQQQPNNSQAPETTLDTSTRAQEAPEITEKTFTFANGNSARAVYAPRKIGGQAVLDALRLPAPKALVILACNGEDLGDTLRLHLHRLFSRGVARAAGEAGAALVTNAMNSGAVRLLGTCLAEHDHNAGGIIGSWTRSAMRCAI